MKRKLKRNKAFLKIVATTTALQMVGTGSMVHVFANEEVEVPSEVVQESTDIEEDALIHVEIEVEADEVEAEEVETDEAEEVVSEVVTTFDVAPMTVELIDDEPTVATPATVTVGDLVISDTTGEGTPVSDTHYRYNDSTNVLTIIKAGNYTIALSDDTKNDKDGVATTAIVVKVEAVSDADVNLTLSDVYISADTAALEVQASYGDVTIFLEGDNFLSSKTGVGLFAVMTGNKLTIDGSDEGYLYAFGERNGSDAYGIHVAAGDLVIKNCGTAPTNTYGIPGVFAMGATEDSATEIGGIYVEDGTLLVDDSFIYAAGDDFGIKVEEVWLALDDNQETVSIPNNYADITISGDSVVVVSASDNEVVESDTGSYGISGYITLENNSYLGATGNTGIVGLLQLKDDSTVLAKGTEDAFSGEKSTKPASASPLVELNFASEIDYSEYLEENQDFSIYAYHEDENEFEEVQVTYRVPSDDDWVGFESALYGKVMFNLPKEGVYTIFAGASGAEENDDISDDFFYYKDGTNNHLVFTVTDGLDAETNGYTLFENVDILTPDWTYDSEGTTVDGTTDTISVGLGNEGFQEINFGSVTIKEPNFDLGYEAILEADLLTAFAVDILTDTVQENIVYAEVSDPDPENHVLIGNTAPTTAGTYRAYFSLDQTALGAGDYSNIIMGYVEYTIESELVITATNSSDTIVEGTDYECVTTTDVETGVSSTVLHIYTAGKYTISNSTFKNMSNTPIQIDVTDGDVELTLDSLYIAVPDTAPSGTNALKIVSGDADVTLNLNGWVYLMSNAGDGIMSESTGTLTINGDGSDHINCLFANSDLAEDSSRTQGYGIYVNGGDLVIENCGAIPSEITDGTLPGVFAMGSSTDFTGAIVKTVGIKVVGGTIEIDDSFVCAFGETFGIDATTVETTGNTYCDIDLSGSVVVVSTTSNNGTGISGNMTLTNESYINATGKVAIVGGLFLEDTSTVLAKGTEQAFSGYQSGTPFSALPLMDLSFTDNLLAYIDPDEDKGLSIYTYHEDDNTFKEVQVSYATPGWDGGGYETTLYPNVMFNVAKEGNHTIFVGDSGATTNDEVSDDFFHHVDENNLNHVVFYVTEGDGTPSATGYTAFDKVNEFTPEWVYTLIGKDTIGVTLGNDGFEEFDFGTVTIKAPTSTTYTGKAIAATLSNDLLTAFEVDILTDDVEILYANLTTGELLDSAPSAVGSYEAYFSFDFNIQESVVAYVEYSITAASSSSSSGSSASSSNSTTSSSSSSSTDSGSTFVPTTTTTTGTSTTTAPTTVTNTPIIALPTTTTVANTVVTVDEATGNTVKTTEYSNGAEVVQTVTSSGSVSAEISGITTKTEMVIPLDETPSITEVVVIVYEDGTREIIKDTAIVSDGFRIVLDSNATIEIVDNAKSFNDVVAGSWYADSVAFATSRELFTGMGEGIFAPTGTMTRAMIWQVLYNYQGSDTATSGTEWYAKAQAWATDFGVSDGTNPNSEMTREQLVTLLYRMGGTGATSGQYDSFSDSGNVSDWASDAMNWAVAEGIIAGSNGNLNPKGNATRAEVAAIMMRFISM